jgi:hypothetical protein
MYPRFSSVDFGLVWLLIRGHINQLMTHLLEPLRFGSAMVVAVVEVVDVEAIMVEVVVNHLQTLTELISAQLRMQ